MSPVPTVQLYKKTKSSLPLTELCALSSRRLHLSHNPPPAGPAGPVFDPTEDKKRMPKLLEGGEKPTFKHK